MKLTEAEAAIEAILFVSGEAVSAKKLAFALEQNESTTKSIIRNLMLKYDKAERGLKIIEINNAYQMCTKAEYFEYIRKLYTTQQKQILSQTLLETLAIVAYKQPITKSQIEEIRGVSADHAINKLVERNLVKEVGRSDAPGKPILFGTTEEFLRYFGFTSADGLPKIEDIHIEENKENKEQIIT